MAADAENSVCSVEDGATITFDPVDTSMQKKLGDRVKWLRNSTAHYPTLLFAMATLEKDSTELDRIGRQVGAKTLIEMVDGFNDPREYSEALVASLRAVSLRTMTTSAQMVLSGDADGPGTGADIIEFRRPRRARHPSRRRGNRTLG
jgi:hypothetical protein